MAESTESLTQGSEPREDAGLPAAITAEQNGEEQGAAADADAADAGDMPAMNASLRALIVSADASIIIGKQGKHINEVREKSGARLAIVSTGRQVTCPMGKLSKLRWFLGGFPAVSKHPRKPGKNHDSLGPSRCSQQSMCCYQPRAIFEDAGS